MELVPAIRWGALGPLVVAALAVMGSPGPATISLAAAGSSLGLRRSLAYLAGLAIGTGLVLVAVAAGITATVLAVPLLRAAFTVVAAAYIVRLALQMATAAPLAARRAASPPASLARGTLLGVANPKAWIALGAVFASVRVADTPTADAIAKLVVLGLLIVPILAGWLLAGATLSRALRDPRRARAVNGALAAALVGAAAFALLH